MTRLRKPYRRRVALERRVYEGQEVARNNASRLLADAGVRARVAFLSRQHEQQKVVEIAAIAHADPLVTLSSFIVASTPYKLVKWW